MLRQTVNFAEDNPQSYRHLVLASAAILVILAIIFDFWRLPITIFDELVRSFFSFWWQLLLIISTVWVVRRVWYLPSYRQRKFAKQQQRAYRKQQQEKSQDKATNFAEQSARLVLNAITFVEQQENFPMDSEAANIKAITVYIEGYDDLSAEEQQQILKDIQIILSIRKS